MVKTAAKDSSSKYKEKIALFRAKEPGSILLEDEEIIEIIKKKEKESFETKKPPSENSSKA